MSFEYAKEVNRRDPSLIMYELSEMRYQLVYMRVYISRNLSDLLTMVN